MFQGSIRFMRKCYFFISLPKYAMLLFNETVLLSIKNVLGNLKITILHTTYLCAKCTWDWSFILIRELLLPYSDMRCDIN